MATDGLTIPPVTDDRHVPHIRRNPSSSNSTRRENHFVFVKQRVVTVDLLLGFHAMKERRCST